MRKGYNHSYWPYLVLGNLSNVAMVMWTLPCVGIPKRMGEPRITTSVSNNFKKCEIRYERNDDDVCNNNDDENEMIWDQCSTMDVNLAAQHTESHNEYTGQVKNGYPRHKKNFQIYYWFP